MRILVIQHEDPCPPGWVGEWLVAGGAELDIRRPDRGEELPADLSGHQGLLILGGAANANSDAEHPWLTPTKALVRDAVAGTVPTLGICLGHQLCAVALGGRVDPNPRGQQLGVLPIGWRPDAATDPVLAGLVAGSPGLAGIQWNHDIVHELPPGAEVLAQAPGGEVQVARFAPAVWGLQCHPEAGSVLVRGWADRGTPTPAQLEVIDLVSTREPELRRDWRPLVDGFLAACRPD